MAWPDRWKTAGISHTLARQIKDSLPSDVRLFTQNGKTIFPIHSSSGGLRAAVYACLLADVEGKTYGGGIELTMSDSPAAIADKVHQAITRMRPIDLNNGLPDLDGSI